MFVEFLLVEMSQDGEISNRERDDGSEMWRRNNMHTGCVLTVIITINVFANGMSAIRKKLGLGSNVVGL